MNKIKEQLAGVAALIGVLAAIGGGFVKYGEVMTRMNQIEESLKNYQPLIQMVLFVRWGNNL